MKLRDHFTVTVVFLLTRPLLVVPDVSWVCNTCRFLLVPLPSMKTFSTTCSYVVDVTLLFFPLFEAPRFGSQFATIRVWGWIRRRG